MMAISSRRGSRAARFAAALVLVALALSGPARAEPPPAGACDPSRPASCEVGGGAPSTAPPRAAPAPPSRRVLVVFWGEGCPHCEQARPVVASLAAAHPSLAVEWVEVRRDPAGRERFLATVKRLGIESAGVPLFVLGDEAIVGFRGHATEVELATAVDRALEGLPDDEARRIDLPLVGSIDPTAVSLPALTVIVGLADGINPCAFYVLFVLLGILLHVGSRARVALYGGVFVVMSGVVYFLFMTAWLGLFLLVGVARWVTGLLGAVLLVMGLVNLKDTVWFKKGVSLVIPDRAKPGLFRRMRAIANAASLPTALVGISALAFLVNLVELGCTLGLPAMYTRVLSLRHGLSTLGRYAYLVLYNVAYVVPLALIVVVYVVTLHRLALTERRAKLLKAASGALLVLFGALFLLAPALLR
jgi:thiol-disulfide isomerase/thioredoxin